MRVAIAHHANDFRLGANEAPPAIMSIYVGDQLRKVIEDIVLEPSNKLQRMPSNILLGTNSLPPLPRDYSDRNRTSPFAFTGNKFEFRAVGSSQACARPGMILNTIAAESMIYVADEIEKEIATGIRRELAINNVVTRVLKEHHMAVFNGNGYAEEWVTEAEKRGLKNLRTAPEAIKEFNSEKNIRLFESMKVLSKREVESQQHILYETFSKTVDIESECLLQMVTSYVLPTALEYKKSLAQTLDSTVPVQANHLKNYNNLITDLLTSIDKLKQVKEKAKAFSEEHLHDQAAYNRGPVMDCMNETRKIADSIEAITDDKLWPFPKYSEILLMK